MRNYERATLSINGTLELIEYCLLNLYFKVGDKSYTQTDVLSMRSHCQQVANLHNKRVEHQNCIASSSNIPKMWIRCAHDTFTIETKTTIDCRKAERRKQ